MPIDLLKTVEQAFRILDWHEGHTREELPPKWMWPLEHELKLWFEEVDRKRDARLGLNKDDEDLGGMMQNEYAAEIKGRRGN